MNIPIRHTCLLGAFALACAAPAAAAPGHGHGPSGTSHGKHKNPNVTYVFKGTWNGDGTVAVQRGNSFVRKAHLVGTSIAFDITGARLVVADVNGDGSRDAADLQPGDKVVVKARLPRKGDLPSTVTARMLVDQTHPPTTGA